MQILIVTTEAQDHQDIQQTLDSTYKIVHVPDVTEALSVDDVDLVLFYDNALLKPLPETLLELVERGPEAPLIFVAEAGNESIAAEALEFGVCDILIKDAASAYLQLLPLTIDRVYRQWRRNACEIQIDTYQQAEQEIKQRTAQLEALRQVALELTAQLDLDTLLYSLVARAIELVGGDSGVLYLYRREQDVLKLTTCVGSNTPPPGSMLHRREGLAGMVWATGKPLIVDNYQQWSNRAEIYADYDWTAMMGVPIRWGMIGPGEEFLGVLDILARSGQTFSSADVDLLSLFAIQAAIAIRNARLYEEIRQRSLEQETLSQIAHALNTLEVQDAFPVLVEGIKTLIHCDRVSVALLDHEAEQFSMLILESSVQTLMKGAVMPFSATASMKSILAGQPHLTQDLSSETDFPGEKMLYEAGFRSRMNLPLLVGKQTVGSLNLASCRPHFFHQDQLPVLQQVADILASAVENTRLYKIERYKRQEADTLREAALVLTTALHKQDVIERILAQLQQVVPYDTCSVQLYRADSEHDDGEGWLEIVGGRGFPNWPDILGLIYVVGGDNPNTEVVRTQATVIEDDVLIKYKNFQSEPHEKADIHSWLGVPMLVGNRLVGMIALDKQEIGFYTEEHAQLAEAFAAQAAVAFENAQLYEAEQKRSTQLGVVNQVARKAVSILNPHQLFQEIVTAIQQGFGYHNVILLLLDETTQTLTNQAVAGGFEAITQADYNQPVGDGVIGWVAQTGESLLINDISQDSRYIVGFSQEVPTQSELCVPLKLDQEVIGVLDVQETRVNAFDKADLFAMETLADQISAALQNARLYGRVQQDRDTMSILLNEVNHRVKNNLTGIIGLLYMARSRAQVKDKETYQTTMDELIGRVRGLASVHGMLSESEWTPLRLSDLASEIIHAALRALPYDESVSVKITDSPVRITSDQAHNLALVINELATNTVKYALSKQNTACITFHIERRDRLIRCEYKDNGPGYPDDVLRRERHNVGFDLIENIVRGNLHGEWSLSNNEGAVAIIELKAEV